MSNRMFRSRALAAASILALTVGLSVTARAETAKTDDGELVVTGSHIVNVGMKAPTPVTAVTAMELTSLAPPGKLIQALSQLPQFYGNTNNDVRTGFFGSPGSGNLNLRGLNTGGSSRTLTLLDGRRVVPATGFGSVDINVLPQALIKRIDTVTGGASAAYGTDAVAGAVNFILNTSFSGWILSAQAGVTGHSDHDNMQFSAAWGSRLGDRAHLLLSGEYYHADPINSIAERDWYKGYSLILNPNTDPATTRYLLLPNTVSSIATFGGLINSGVPTTSALYRRYFRPDGTLAPFILGQGTATSAHSIANGGSGDDATANLIALSPEARRASGFVYLDYDATPNLKLYVQGLIGESMVDQPDHGGRFAAVAGLDTRITIFRENAFLPAAVAKIMDAEKLTSFQMNLVGDREGLGRHTHLKQDNLTYSGTIGFNWENTRPGLFNGWHVRGYAQYGRADNKGYQEGIILNRISAAVDAVVDPSSGRIVCRAALVNPTKWGSCVPINLFGRGAPSAAAIDYVTQFTTGQTITSPLFFQPDGYASGETVTFTSGPGKVYNTMTSQTVGELSVSGKVWDGWAGPVLVAFGGAFRREAIRQIVYDPSAPASDPSIFAAVDPALRGVPVYTLGRFSMIQNSGVANVHGDYIVKEGFAEVQAPLLADLPGVEQLNLLAAARYADYTGSGGVWSWKAGLDWQVFSDLRLRGTVSRDVRAATLQERFNRTGGVGTVTKDPAFPNDGTQTFSGVTGGSPNINPEVSTTYTYGVIYQPRWLSGFSASVDYYKIDIDGAIGALGFQRIVDDCFADPKNPECALVKRDPVTNRLVQVLNVSQNIAAAAGRGVDVEVSYRRAVRLFGNGDEAMTTRIFWSHLIEDSTTTDRTNPATYFDAAGQQGPGSALPRHSVTGIQTYDKGPFSLSMTERFISAGILNKRYNLPGARPDVADNTVPAVIYFNLAASYTFNAGRSSTVQFYANIENLFDKDPPVTPSVFDASLGQTGNQVNTALYDLLGRRFTFGVRIRH